MAKMVNFVMCDFNIKKVLQSGEKKKKRGIGGIGETRLTKSCKVWKLDDGYRGIMVTHM